MLYIGEISAIATAVSWSACALLFTAASHRIGSFSMSHYRMLFGIILIIIIKFFVTGTFFPHNVSVRDWILLSASGFTGFFLADIGLFQSYVDIGPRLGALVFNLYPLIGALLAWLFLGEYLPLLAWIGMGITILGVIWVVLEKSQRHINLHREHFVRGVSLAFFGAVVQGFSFLLAKPAMTGTNSTDPLTATLIRAIVACAAYWIVSTIRGRFVTIVKKSQDRKAMGFIAIGAIFGPSFGVWLSMVAIKYAPIGIASTLMALMPVTILPMTTIVYKEKISWRAVIGAIIACIGVAILLNAK